LADLPVFSIIQLSNLSQLYSNMDQISNQFAHIFIHYYSNKTASACKLFISEPTQNQERLLGRLFGILEINIPSRENNQLINLLISSLEDNYYANAENENLNIAECFENALKEVNQKFIQIIKDKQIPLVGNLNENTIREKINLAVGVLKDEQVHISYLNNINIHLIHKTKQDYKLIDIKKIAQEEETVKSNKENISLFGNLLSGEVKPADYLILANDNFLEYISTERVQKIITSLPLHKATEYFKNSLLQFEGQNFAAILIKNSLNETQASKEPASLTSITELNYTESATEKLLAPSILNLVKNVPTIVSQWLKQMKKARPAEKLPEQNELPGIPARIAKTPGQNFSLKNSFLAQKKRLTHFLENNAFIAKHSTNLKNKLNIKLAIWRNKYRAVPKLSKILFGAALILLLLFIISILFFKQRQGQTISQSEYHGLISQIETLESQAESDLIYGNEDKAKTEITDAQNLLATLPVASKKQKDTHDALDKKIQQIVAKLRHITVIDNPTLVADLGTQQENNLDIQNLIYQNNTLLAFNSSNNTNFQINLSNQEIKKNTSNLPNIGPIVRAKDIGGAILLYQAKNSFITFQNNSYSAFDVALPANSSLADFAGYNDKLYTLDLTSSQIYRHPKTDTGFGAGVAWLRSNQDLKDIVSLAIDNNIWLLDKKGIILKFTKGNKQTFAPQGLDPVLESPTRLFTNDQTNFLYILEPKNKRIIVLDKAGKMAAQYYSDTFDNLKDFSVDEKDKKIFVANGDKIYSFALSHLK